MSNIDIHHNRAASYALQARYWFIVARLSKSDGNTLSMQHAFNAWQRKWDAAERHSDRASKEEQKTESIFPGM